MNMNHVPFIDIGLFHSSPEKKSNRGNWGWGYEISRGIKEIACGRSSGYLKTKWNFQGWARKNNVEFPGVLIFGLGISKWSSTILWTFQQRSFLLSGIFREKVKKWKIPGKGGRGGKKVYPQHPLPLFVFFLE